ncbi:endoplasmin [Tanacetum coccineum]
MSGSPAFVENMQTCGDLNLIELLNTYNEPLGRGTRIRLHLREETGEYLEESKLKVSADEDDSSGEDEKPVGATDGEEKEEDSDKEEDEEKLKNT